MTKLFSTPVDLGIVFRAVPGVWKALAVIGMAALLGFTVAGKVGEQAQLPKRVASLERGDQTQDSVLAVQSEKLDHILCYLREQAGEVRRSECLPR